MSEQQKPPAGFFTVDNRILDELDVYHRSVYIHYCRLISEDKTFEISPTTAAKCGMGFTKLRSCCKHLAELGHMPHFINANNGKPKWVYVISDGHGNYKIGLADNPESRRGELQTGNPFPLQIIFQKLLHNAIHTERSLHEQWSHKRLNGEWFELNDDDLVIVIKFLGEITNE